MKTFFGQDPLTHAADDLMRRTDEIALLQKQVDRQASHLLTELADVRDQLSELVKAVVSAAGLKGDGGISEATIEKMSYALHLQGLNPDRKTAKAYKRLIKQNPGWKAASLRGYRGIRSKTTDAVRAPQPVRGAIRSPSRKEHFTHYYKGPLDGPAALHKRVGSWLKADDAKRYREIAGLIAFAHHHPELQAGLLHLDEGKMMRGLLAEAKRHSRFYRAVAMYAIATGPRSLQAAAVQGPELTRCAEYLGREANDLLPPLVSALASNAKFRQACAAGARTARIDQKRTKIAVTLETKPTQSTTSAIQRQLATEAAPAQAKIVLTKAILLPLAAWAEREQSGGPARRLLQSFGDLEGARRILRKHKIQLPTELRLITRRPAAPGPCRVHRAV